jgi:cytidylate kinase
MRVGNPQVIAIDGPVASGKTTVGRELAIRLGFRFVDTGLMYRAVTYLALRASVDLTDAAALGALAENADISIGVATVGADPVFAGGEEVTAYMRTPEVEASVSLVAQVREVRLAMVAQQQQMAREGGVVMVGRDIGTKVVPDATKVFLDASEGERVRRRLDEILARGGTATEAAVRENLVLRDRTDSVREEGPLTIAADAVRILTDGLDVAGVVSKVIDVVGREAPDETR